MPSKPCGPIVMPRRRARSASENCPSGLSRAIMRSAPIRSASGRNRVAITASCASAASRVAASTTTGSRSKNWRMIRTCSSPISPRSRAPATFGNTGANCSPVIVRRGTNCSASAIRRRAAPLPICKRRDNTSAYEVPPNSTGEACPVTFGTNLSPRDANRRCTTSRRANTANASPAVKSSIDSAQKASTAAPNTPIELMFEYEQPPPTNRPICGRRNYWGERDLRAVNLNNSAPLWSRIADASSADRPSSI